MRYSTNSDLQRLADAIDGILLHVRLIDPWQLVDSLFKGRANKRQRAARYRAVERTASILRKNGRLEPRWIIRPRTYKSRLSPLPFVEWSPADSDDTQSPEETACAMSQDARRRLGSNIKGPYGGSYGLVVAVSMSLRTDSCPVSTAPRRRCPHPRDSHRRLASYGRWLPRRGSCQSHGILR